MKIDAEGSEVDIIRGGMDALHSAQIPFIIMEISPEHLALFETSQMELRNLMAELEYDT